VQGRSREGGDRWQDEDAIVQVDPIWIEALEGLEGFSHIWIVWWLHHSADPPDSLSVRPQRRQEMPEVGLFATRSPRRPNPLAMTAVRLIERTGGTLRVNGLDAYQGTPILDIKPYLPRGDLIVEATGPEWLQRLWSIDDRERA
jgi:tRNA-Thr(GGU) m(6)t(6)A37 methyltransferase TsaA